jgi:hypothetical protein
MSVSEWITAALSALGVLGGFASAFFYERQRRKSAEARLAAKNKSSESWRKVASRQAELGQQLREELDRVDDAHVAVLESIRTAAKDVNLSSSEGVDALADKWNEVMAKHDLSSGEDTDQ